MALYVFFAGAAGAGVIGQDLLVPAPVGEISFRQVYRLLLCAAHALIGRVQSGCQFLPADFDILCIDETIQDHLTCLFRPKRGELIKKSHNAHI